MKIFIGELRTRPGMSIELEMSEKQEALNLEEETIPFLSPIQLKLSISNTGSTIRVQGIIVAELELTCSRCLSLCTYRMEAPYEEEFYFEIKNGKHLSENISEIAHPYQGKIIDITDTVMQTILLALPMKALCDPQCRGLCFRCGVNLNEKDCNCRNEDLDPRLAALEVLKKNLSEFP